MAGAMQRQRTLCVHRLAKDRNQAMQFVRFLGNPAVSTPEMLAAAGRQSGERAQGRRVLAIEDTTELHLPTHGASKRGFGMGGNGEDLGLFLHPVLAMDAANGWVIGLVECVVLNRTESKVADRRSRSADAKESRRWLLRRLGRAGPRDAQRTAAGRPAGTAGDGCTAVRHGDAEAAEHAGQGVARDGGAVGGRCARGRSARRCGAGAPAFALGDARM